MTGCSSTPETTPTNCWSAAPSTNPTSWPTTSSTATLPSRWSNWSGSPDPAGPWRKPSSSPRTRPAWTTTRFANTTPGTATSPYPCSPPPSSPSPPTPNVSKKKKGQHNLPRTTDPFILQRNQTTLGHLHQTIAPPTTHRPLVPLATTPPNPRPGMPLPAPTPHTSQDAAVVLGRP